MVTGEQILLFLPEQINSDKVPQQRRRALDPSHLPIPLSLPLPLPSIDRLIKHNLHPRTEQPTPIDNPIKSHPSPLESPIDFLDQTIPLCVECVAGMGL